MGRMSEYHLNRPLPDTDLEDCARAQRESRPRWYCHDCEGWARAEWITSDSLPTCWDCGGEDIEQLAELPEGIV